MNYSLELPADCADDAEYIRDGVGCAEEIGTERTGVTHLVHAWHQQGHPVCLLNF